MKSSLKKITGLGGGGAIVESVISSMIRLRFWAMLFAAVVEDAGVHETFFILLAAVVVVSVLGL